MAEVLLVGHAMDFYLADLGVEVHAYRRAQREVFMFLSRSARIRASSFNLNSFSSEQLLAFFRLLPEHIGQLSALLHVDASFAHPNFAVEAVECLCIVLRRHSAPVRWSDLEEVFGRSSSALSFIFLATFERLVE